MIRNDLSYALSAGRPMLIDPIKVETFLNNANLVLSNPDFAYHLSALTNNFENKEYKTKNKKQASPSKNPYSDDSEDIDIHQLMCCSKPPYVEDGMGIITCKGVIGKGLTPVEVMLGCCDIQMISETLDAWEDRSDVQEIVFKFDSGGGSTCGLQEMAKKIRTYSKPTFAYCEDDCGSAAYWLASQCSRFMVTPSSSIGGVGIYLTMKDESKKRAEEGIKIVVIKSGDYKAAGVENTPLTDLQFQRLQDEVIELHNRFIRDVLSVRIFAKREDMQGQSFYGDDAVINGFATDLIENWKEAVEIIKTERTQGNPILNYLVNRQGIGIGSPSITTKIVNTGMQYPTE